MGQKQERLRTQLTNAEILHRTAEAEHYRIVIAVNEELARAGEPAEFDAQEIAVTPHGVHEVPLGSRRLSSLLTRLAFPSVTKKRVSHYTSYDSFLAIVETGQLRLYAVRKRIAEHELQTLLDELGFRGSEVDPASGKAIYEELSDDLFYISLTPEQNSSYLWKTFAKNATGVRLDFYIEAQIDDFRSISYSPMNSPVVKLVGRLRNDFHKLLLLRGISRLCAFHLPSLYGEEHEDRLLVARHADNYKFSYKSETDPAGHSYIELPIGNEGCLRLFRRRVSHYKIQLVGVSPGAACDLRRFQADVSRLRIDNLIC
jgi:hypothetical protein